MYPFRSIADPWNFIYIRALSARQIDLRSFTKTWTIYQLWWLHTQSYLQNAREMHQEVRDSALETSLCLKRKGRKSVVR